MPKIPTVWQRRARLANTVWAQGRQDTVLQWMEWFSDNDLVERHPEISVHGACCTP
jgi:hypothetical protein